MTSAIGAITCPQGCAHQSPLARGRLGRACPSIEKHGRALQQVAHATQSRGLSQQHGLLSDPANSKIRALWAPAERPSRARIGSAGLDGRPPGPARPRRHRPPAGGAVPDLDGPSQRWRTVENSSPIIGYRPAARVRAGSASKRSALRSPPISTAAIGRSLPSSPKSNPASVRTGRHWTRRWLQRGCTGLPWLFPRSIG